MNECGKVGGGIFFGIIIFCTESDLLKTCAAFSLNYKQCWLILCGLIITTTLILIISHKHHLNPASVDHISSLEHLPFLLCSYQLSIAQTPKVSSLKKSFKRRFIIGLQKTIYNRPSHTLTL